MGQGVNRVKLEGDRWPTGPNSWNAVTNIGLVRLSPWEKNKKYREKPYLRVYNHICDSHIFLPFPSIFRYMRRHSFHWRRFSVLIIKYISHIRYHYSRSARMWNVLIEPALILVFLKLNLNITEKTGSLERCLLY